MFRRKEKEKTPLQFLQGAWPLLGGCWCRTAGGGPGGRGPLGSRLQGPEWRGQVWARSPPAQREGGRAGDVRQNRERRSRPIWPVVRSSPSHPVSSFGGFLAAPAWTFSGSSLARLRLHGHGWGREGRGEGGRQSQPGEGQEVGCGERGVQASPHPPGLLASSPAPRSPGARFADRVPAPWRVSSSPFPERHA